ncbi:histidine phosphatase family protein [Kitasatospora sp. NPDC056651]|uniref:histidine phosphatase family protein n=1 Tax=Kitasatospora sp. NPDC056651 TaxID=3345892 RepID=UPI0036BFE419
MRLVLLRHAETDLNTRDRFQAQADTPLNAEGRRQARETAERLTPGRWAAVHASPLTRAVDTARPAAERLGLPLATLDGLRERHLGTIDGLDRTRYAAEHPEDMRRLLTDPGYGPPGGETGARARGRFVAALRALMAAGHHGPVLVVTHGGVLNLLRGELPGGPRGGMVGNCRAVELDAEPAPDGGLRIERWRWDVAPHECEDGPVAPSRTSSATARSTALR